MCTGYKEALQYKASMQKAICPHKVICLSAPVGFGTTKWLGFPLLVGIPFKPRVWLCLLDFGYVTCSWGWMGSKCREGPVLDGLKKWNWVLMLQTQVLRVGQVNEPCIGINTRELDRELYTGSRIEQPS